MCLSISLETSLVSLHQLLQNVVNWLQVGRINFPCTAKSTWQQETETEKSYRLSFYEWVWLNNEKFTTALVTANSFEQRTLTAPWTSEAEFSTHWNKPQNIYWFQQQHYFGLGGCFSCKNSSVAAQVLNSKDLYVASNSARSFLIQSGKSLQTKVIPLGMQF